MTDNQQRARNFLDRLYDERIKYEQLKRETAELRARAENIKSANAIDVGDTGRIVTDARGNKHAVMAPIPRATVNQGNAKQELAHCLLADTSTKRDIQLKVYIETYNEIHNHIDWLIEDELKRAVVRLRHFSGLTYEQIGEVVNYSEAHTRRMYYEALEEMGCQL